MTEQREKNPAAVALGKLGGKANAEKHGHEHFVKIGQKGGGNKAKSHDHEHYVALGKKGTAKREANLREKIRAELEAKGE